MSLILLSAVDAPFVALDDAGRPLPFATLDFYRSGTTAPAISLAGGSHYVADANGQFDAISLEAETPYRVVHKTAEGVLRFDVDPYVCTCGSQATPLFRSPVNRAVSDAGVPLPGASLTFTGGPASTEISVTVAELDGSVYGYKSEVGGSANPAPPLVARVEVTELVAFVGNTFQVVLGGAEMPEDVTTIVIETASGTVELDAQNPDSVLSGNDYRWAEADVWGAGDEGVVRSVTFLGVGERVPAAVYADPDLDTALPNPLMANAAGFFPPIYGDDDVEYAIKLADASGNVVEEFDPYVCACGLPPIQATLTCGAFEQGLPGELGWGVSLPPANVWGSIEPDPFVISGSIRLVAFYTEDGIGDPSTPWLALMDEDTQSGVPIPEQFVAILVEGPASWAPKLLLVEDGTFLPAFEATQWPTTTFFGHDDIGSEFTVTFLTELPP